MVIVAAACGPSLVTCQDDYSECGALSSITLQSTTGRILLMGTYWPIRHTMDETTLDDQNLWSRLAGYIHDWGLRETPIDYLKRLILTWANTAILAGAKAVILGGDLNATWLPSEAGGQRTLASWASEHSLSNGPRLLAEHRGDTHIITQDPKTANVQARGLIICCTSETLPTLIRLRPSPAPGQNGLTSPTIAHSGQSIARVALSHLSRPVQGKPNPVSNLTLPTNVW